MRPENGSSYSSSHSRFDQFMESPAQNVQRSRQRRKRTWICAGVAAAVVVILAIVIPCAILLPPGPKGPVTPSDVLLPLYVYPESSSTWNPVYNAIDEFPDVNFTIIINPDSGPGNSDGPNDDYVSALRPLNAAPNVRLVGYVRTGYTDRDITAVVQDVQTYAGWSQIDGDVAMHGIFFDEAPSEFSPETAQYLETANQAVKNSTGIREPKLVIHNPGTIPDPGLNDESTDITVVFEQSYNRFQNQASALSSLSGPRSSYSLMVHSVPTGTKLDKLVRTMSQRAQFLFLTTADQYYYEGFANSWSPFTEAMAS